jgi:VanZ family protein
MRTLFRAGFVAHLGLVVLISIGAYTGHLLTSLRGFPHADKLAHAVLIGGLAFFLDGALDHRRLWHRYAFPRLAPVLVLLAAGIEEYLQRLSPRRSSDLGDFAADVVGVCLLTWLSGRYAASRSDQASADAIEAATRSPSASSASGSKGLPVHSPAAQTEGAARPSASTTTA